MGVLAAPAQATFHLNMVNEVMLASTSASASEQFVEFLDQGGTEEQFVPAFAPFRLIVYDAAGNELGQQTLNPSGLRAAAAAGKEYLVSTPAVDAGFGVTGDERLTVSLPLTGGQVCFAGSEPPPQPVSCITYGTITKPVATNSFGTGSVHGPVPPNGESDQRQPDGTVIAAAPTPRAPNRSATTTPPPPKKVGKPIESQLSVTGVAQRKAKLRFTVLAGSNAPALATIRLSLPRGLSFNLKTLARGVGLKGPRAKPLHFSLRLSKGTLTVKLKAAARRVSATFGGAAITVSQALARKLKKREVKQLTLVVSVTDAKGKVSRFISQVSVR